MYEIAQKKKILLIEDDVAIQQVLSFFLKQHDFEVLAIADGGEGIRLIPIFKPDLIILDLIMCPVSGWDVLYWLRAHLLTPRIPVLVVSALVHVSDKVRGFEAGALEYITKPTQPSIIVERVHTLLTLNSEQCAQLQRKRINEQRTLLTRISAPLPDEFVY
ncbi:MAG: hypothetical protein NVS2B12_06560 [Ktedonobacteraceae bacterium]